MNFDPKESPTSRKKRIEEFLLINNFNNLSIGDTVTCIEDRLNGKYGSYVGFHGGDYAKAASVTLGKEYKVTDINRNKWKIKIITDSGVERWMSTKRFMFSLKLLRKEKLLQILKNS